MSEQETPQKNTKLNSRKIEPTVMVALITTLGAVIVGIVTSVVAPIVTKQPHSASPSALASPDGQENALTGVWKTEGSILGNATFYVRQDGPIVWWYGQGNDWAHVLKGTLSGKTIKAEWADIPFNDRPPKPKRSGTMTVTVISDTEMSVNDTNLWYSLKRIK